MPETELPDVPWPPHDLLIGLSFVQQACCLAHFCCFWQAWPGNCIDAYEYPMPAGTF